jgi:hypothetical protein
MTRSLSEQLTTTTINKSWRHKKEKQEEDRFCLQEDEKEVEIENCFLVS